MAWARCLGARARALRVHDLGYGAAFGIAELRAAILAHVSVTRGVVATPDQVLVMPSTSAAIDLIARLLLRPGVPGGDLAWIEEPGYPNAQALLRAAGAQLIPVPCDADGINVSGASGPAPRLVYVTPSHEYPTGASMGLPRRLALLDMAQSCGATVLEDDYGSEFQYGSRPIAALQGIDRGACVASAPSPRCWHPVCGLPTQSCRSTCRRRWPTFCARAICVPTSGAWARSTHPHGRDRDGAAAPLR
jgi:GntR family transcriptional regulator/MocR family aminotransferase